MNRFLAVLACVSVLGGSVPAAAQTYTPDARKIGMGGASDSSNIAASMVEKVDSYSVIVLPFGLFQVLDNLDKYDPGSDAFDPVSIIENVSSPLHYTTGRDSNPAEHPDQRFIADLVNGRVNRDLSTYRTFNLPLTNGGEGLASGLYGKTFKFAKQANGAYHGVFVGAGPYLSFGTTLDVDPRLSQIFGSDTALFFPNTSMNMLNDSTMQFAMSIGFGYRGRFAFPGAVAAAAPSGSAAPADPSARDGIYVAANYRYLKGFKYMEPDTTVRFDTNAQGLIVVTPPTPPLTINNLEGDSGSGRAVDVGVMVVRNRYEAGIGVNGIGNQIEWSDIVQKRYLITSLVQGQDFVEQRLPTTLTEVDVKLPVVTTGSFGVDLGDWAVRTSAGHGFNGNSFRGGVERRFGMFAVRGGARLSRERWDPTYGVGFGGKVAVDVGVFGTHANLQDKRETAIAVSLRINHS
jgi:hypothetical protein